jgi:hypothetical protein
LDDGITKLQAYQQETDNVPAYTLAIGGHLILATSFSNIWLSFRSKVETTVV